MDKCFSPGALMLGPSVPTCYFLVQLHTGLSLFTLNLHCRSLAVIGTSYMTSTIAVPRCASQLRRISQKTTHKRWDVPIGAQQVRGTAEVPAVKEPRQIHRSFFPPPHHSALSSFHSFLPFGFPGQGESRFPVPPALFLCLSQLLSGNCRLPLARQLFLSQLFLPSNGFCSFCSTFIIFALCVCIIVICFCCVLVLPLL